MNLRFALGFTLLILLFISIFVGLPYLLQNAKSFDFSYLFRQSTSTQPIIDSYE
ncbi:MAG: hypothetical protein Q7K16_04410 [Candidatus Azambacteria bacterium]|nr:hypothetical protein [Candidatus Azambacteria bacterium]